MIFVLNMPSAAYIQLNFLPEFFVEAYNRTPDQTAPCLLHMEHSDFGP